jgi:hypothetical protein
VEEGKQWSAPMCVIFLGELLDDVVDLVLRQTILPVVDVDGLGSATVFAIRDRKRQGWSATHTVLSTALPFLIPSISISKVEDCHEWLGVVLELELDKWVAALRKRTFP